MGFAPLKGKNRHFGSSGTTLGAISIYSKKAERDKRQRRKVISMVSKRDVGIFLVIAGFAFVLQPPAIALISGVANTSIGAIMVIVGLYLFAK